MRADNFIAFATISGFFAGLVFCVFRVASASELLMYTVLITFGFHIVAHLAVMNFIDARREASASFDKKSHELIANEFVKEINARDEKIRALKGVIKEELKEVSHEPKKKAQAAS